MLNKTHQQAEYYFKEGCFITELSNSDDVPELSVARVRVESGVTTRWHYLKNTIERYLILEGVGLAEVGDKPAVKVVENDVVIISAFCRQRITNTGKKDLVFLAICSPRFKIENYAELEKTTE